MTALLPRRHSSFAVSTVPACSDLVNDLVRTHRYILISQLVGKGGIERFGYKELINFMNLNLYQNSCMGGV